MIDNLDLSHVNVRLNNINKNATQAVSFQPSEVILKLPDSYSTSRLACLEDSNSIFNLDPSDHDLMSEWNTYAYDESIQDYMALEGTLMFCSFSMIKVEKAYRFNLKVLPFFITAMKKFEKRSQEEIRYNQNPSAERNSIMVDSEISMIKESVEPNSIVLVDGPLIGRQASTKMVTMDREMRSKNCIPLYFVKNSNSRLIIDGDSDTNLNLDNHFNSDFHWACHKLKNSTRSPFFKYTEQVEKDGKKFLNKNHSKIFTYMKPLAGFPERVEMHSETYEKYYGLMPKLMNLISYLYLVQGDYTNPQVRPVAIAEKYAREGLRIMNIPVLLRRLGFRPTINQVRFG